MPDKIGDTILRYGGHQTDLLMAPALEARMREAVKFLGQLGLGAVVAVDSMGTYNKDSKLPGGSPSLHAIRPPHAIDVSGVEWENGRRIRALDRLTQPELYWRVEACLRLAQFGTVLGWDYSADHHSHFHCDDGQPWGMAGRSQDLFVRGTLPILGYPNVQAAQAALGQATDGQCGPKTLAALCKALIAHGADSGAGTATPCIRIGDKRIPYRMEGDTAMASVRAVAEALGATVDGFPEIVVTAR